MDMENHISGAARLLCKYDLTGLRLLQQIQFSKNNTLIIRHCPVFVKWKFPTQETFPFEDYGCPII